MLIEDGRIEPGEARRVAGRVFAIRASHAIPEEISDPPASWSATYAMLAADLDIEATAITDAMAYLRRFWSAARAATDEEE